MTKESYFIDSRRDLRERAFQALFSYEFNKSLESHELTDFSYTYDKPIEEETEYEVPEFLKGLVQGVIDNEAELDERISKNLKEGWSIDRLTLPDKVLLRLGLYEMDIDDSTPDRVVVNEMIEIAKKYSDTTSAKFINGILTKYVTDEN